MIEIGIIASSPEQLDRIDFNYKFKFARIIGAYIPDYKLEPINSIIPLYTSSNQLVGKAEALIFLGEHNTYNCLIVNALKNTKHVKICSPENYNASQLSNFLKLALEANVCIATCSEWHNDSSISSGLHYVNSPSLIEFKQSIGFDIKSKPFEFYKKKIYNAIYFSLITLRSNPKRIYALGISTFTKTIDFINASIEFDNGSIIRLQIGAIDSELYTKCRMHQKNAIASFDLQQLKSDIHFLNVFKDIDTQFFESGPNESDSSIKKSMEDFIENIKIHRYHHKTMEFACEAALLTEQILDKLKIRSEIRQLFAID